MAIRITLGSTEDVLIEVPAEKVPAVLDELDTVQVKWEDEPGAGERWAEALTNGEFIYDEFQVGNLPVIASVTGHVIASVLVSTAA